MYITFKMTAFNVTVNVTTPLSRETVVMHNVCLIYIGLRILACILRQRL